MMPITGSTEEKEEKGSGGKGVGGKGVKALLCSFTTPFAGREGIGLAGFVVFSGAAR